MAEIEIILCDVDPEIVRAWRRHFPSQPGLTIQHGDMMEVFVDAYVSPANSFGVMDGGFDLVLRDRFPSVETVVAHEIGKRGGRLPVGHAIVVETLDYDVPYLVCTTTMEQPSRVGNTNNAERAMAALLEAVSAFNEENPSAITSIAIPGLCTGVGCMLPDDSAMQMARAYLDWLET